MTLLTGDGSDYDYSALSCASDSSFNCPPLHEEEAIKGAFYKRAQKAPDLGSIHEETLLSSARKLYAIINVGGLRYQLPWTTLEDFPLSRLGQLHLCSSFDEIMCICDDYDVTHNEFFFDRNPCAFRTILTFLRAGKLRSLREMCALSFREELLYWGVPEESLEWCCRRRLLQRVEEVEAMERAEEEEELLEDMMETDSGHREHAAETRVNRCMSQLRDMVERPHSGLPGKIFACLSVLFVTITAGKCSQMCYNIFIVETVCVAWFSLEFTLRFIQDRSKLAFLRHPLNLIDVVAILPLHHPGGEKKLGSGNSYLDKVGLVLRVLRALRILYVMRLARHSLGLQTLGLTARRCTREFGLLLLFLCGHRTVLPLTVLD
ncbi:hypothetical protein F7725_001152 [Dissostichus mawsoni]|uniref:Potassium voltage-gated channel, subfamily G, member 1 n=1 Tax=Dissostichus mawsoni TaxID=36200 RepID=A0A7J5ZJM3_DISMA|nr:hypothetical protein F7725_001152 [Dissostichus mawsoni]